MPTEVFAASRGCLPDPTAQPLARVLGRDSAVNGEDS